MTQSNRPDYRGKPVDFLLAALQSLDWFERAEAARTLCNMGSQATDNLESLLALRYDPSYLVRLQVVRATFHLGEASEQVISILREMITDENEIVRSYASEALKKFE
jgi:HEAT repeat protein